MKWTFPQLAEILKPFMPENRKGKLNQDDCVKILFSKVTSNPEEFIQDVLNPKTSLRQYYTGNTGLRGIAPEITSRLDKYSFECYLDTFTESAKSNVSKEIKRFDPTSDVYKTTMPRVVTNIFVGLLETEAGNKDNDNKKIFQQKKLLKARFVLVKQFWIRNLMQFLMKLIIQSYKCLATMAYMFLV